MSKDIYVAPRLKKKGNIKDMTFSSPELMCSCGMGGGHGGHGHHGDSSSE
ncbi:hypothetical protein BMS3Abin01_01398 [bacterium BMS3Abin01]|nr:hypothetical protein BMS3Abin01_01398 [bacterium BMS3Abin01]